MKCVVEEKEARAILAQCHEGACGGHFAANTTARKILMSRYY
jgi:hypothetical protein